MSLDSVPCWICVTHDWVSLEPRGACGHGGYIISVNARAQLAFSGTKSKGKVYHESWNTWWSLGPLVAFLSF